jgi:hypothetical protein
VVVWTGIVANIACQVVGPAVGRKMYSISKSDLQGHIAGAAVTAMLGCALHPPANWEVEPLQNPLKGL